MANFGVRAGLMLSNISMVACGPRRRSGHGAGIRDSLPIAIPAKGGAHELALLYHEIRNCTSTLRCNAMLLKQDLPPDADLAPVERIERVTASIERMFREVMEPAGEGSQAAYREVRLDALILECVRDYFPGQLGNFRIDLPPGLPAIEGDPGKLRQSLVNLLRNSLEAQARQVVLRAACRGESLTVTLEDDGIGCDAADLSRIFLPAYTTKKAAGGMGMGLALVKACIEAHGGWVRASAPAEGRSGLVIHMAFPLRVAKTESPAPARCPGAQGREGIPTSSRVTVPPTDRAKVPRPVLRILRQAPCSSSLSTNR